MKLSDTEKAFILEGIRLNTCRRDGRANLDFRPFTVQQGVIPHGFGSSQVIFGEEGTKIICSIKSELQKPLPSEPRNGQIKFHLESSQTGSSVAVREDEADFLKRRI
jgi:exosome complex RNA-binding protein Rrp42 (RNase PH superfamily)